MLEQFVEMIEEANKVDLEQTPNLRFLVDLNRHLQIAEVPIAVRHLILSKAELNLREYDPENPLWERFFAAYPVLVKKVFQVSLREFASYDVLGDQISLKLNF